MPSFRNGSAPHFLKGAYRYCRWLTESARSHFGVGLKILPAEKRKAMEVLYAFCRAVDDVVDRPPRHVFQAGRGEQGIGDGRQEELNRWRQELNACSQETASHPITVALQEVMKRYEISRAHLEMILEGVEMDLTKKRYATFSELRLYCERVASAVGLVSIRIFGCRHPASARYAENLGIAFQITNILRDVKADLARGRIYLPQEEIRRFGLSEEDLEKGIVSGSLKKLMAFQAERAKEFFKKAAAARRESGEGRALLPAEIMSGVYRRLLIRIEKADYDVFSRRLSVPRSEQLWVAAKCLTSLS